MGKPIENPIDKETLAILYTVKRMSAPQIASAYGIKTAQIYYLLKKYGIQCRNDTQKNTKFSVNHCYFECVDSAEKAYWLGFLYADGYVTNQHKIGLALSKADISHVEKFRKAIDSTHTIHSYFSSGFSNSEYVRLIFSSEKMAEDLNRLGCTQHKSLTLKFPNENQVPAIYLKDFARGYIDGDGSITTGGIYHPIRLKICGTEEFLEGLRNYFNIIITPDMITAALEKRHKDDKNTYSLTVGSTNRVLSILDELYAGATVFLDRKYSFYIKNVTH